MIAMVAIEVMITSNDKHRGNDSNDNDNDNNNG